MKKPTKTEQKQATKARGAETVRQRCVLQNAFDHELIALACRVIMLNKGATSALFVDRASQAFEAASQECAMFLPKSGQ
jgi:hypothetical protein